MTDTVAAALIHLSEPVISGNEWKYVKDCLDSGWVAAGDYLTRFENDVAGLTGAKHALACVNGTAGLHLALLLAGVSAGDEVIVPTLTFVATINAVKYIQAEPVFMDCDDYLNIDPEKVAAFLERECRSEGEAVINKISGRRVKAILPVHVFGNPCDMAPILETARRYELKVVEDATESLGAFYSSGALKGRYSGTVGDIGVFSFNANKIITTGGGGMLVTDDANTAERARYLVAQAKDDLKRSIHNEVGYNYRLTNLQAAVGVAQLERLAEFIGIKKNNYELLQGALSEVDGLDLVEPPPGVQSNYWFYTVIVDKARHGLDRDELMKKLEAEMIETRPIWYLNHLQKPFAGNQAYRIEKAPWFWGRGLNVPCGSNLTTVHLERVVSALTNRG